MNTRGTRTALHGILLSLLALAPNATFATDPATQPSPAAVRAQHAPDDYDRLRQRWHDLLTGGDFSDPPANQAFVQAVREVEAAAHEHWRTLNRNPGRTYLWADLSDPRRSAHVTWSYRRIKTMVLAHACRASSLAGNPKLLEDALEAMAWMARERYYAGQPTYDNWWDWEIGAPIEINDLLVLLYPFLDDEKRAIVFAAIDHHTPPVRATGANRMWQCKVIALRGILGRDPHKLAAAREGLSPLFDEVLSGDGFHPDGSFIQHGKHPYTGGYGRSLVRDLADLLFLLDDSPWEVTDSNRDRLFKWLRGSFAPFVHQGELMDLVRGREISRHTFTARDAGTVLTGTVLQAARFARPEEAVELQGLAKGWLQLETRDPARRFNGWPLGLARMGAALLAEPEIPPRPGAFGHFRFPAMDRVVHRQPGWTAGLAMYSSRIYNYESINGENLAGWHTGNGALYVYTQNPEAFAEHYWPTIDPHRIPGTTVEAGLPLPGDALSGAAFVGGVDSADGTVGLAAMTLHPPVGSLTGRKAWFFLDDAIVCLGAGIAASGGNAVETILANRKLSTAGGGRFLVNGRPTLDALHPAPAAVNELEEIDWAHIEETKGGIGYVFPDATTIHGVRERRTGTWTGINTYVPDDTRRTNDYLTFWINHGVNPANAGYAYVVLPNRSAEATEAYARAPHMSVLENSAAVQAVESLALGFVGAVFWDASGATVEAGTTIRSSGAIALIITETENTFAVAVSDPSQCATEAVTLDFGRGVTAVISHDPGLTVVQTQPTLRLSFNPSDTRGQTRRACFALESWASEP